MTEEQLKLVSGGYQEWPHDYGEKGWRDISQHYYCTIVNQTYIEILCL